MVFWGMSFIWTTIVFRYYDPITTVFIRLVLSSAILFAGLKVSGKLQIIQKRHYRLFLLSALFNPFLYFLGESFGLKFTSSTISAVVIATIPVFTPVAGYLIFKERLTRLNILGVVLSFSGILIMLVNPDLALTASPLGIFCLLFAVVSAIGYSIFLKKLSSSYSPVTIIAVQNLLGAFFFLPLFLIFGWKSFITTPVTRELISALLQLSIFASSMAFIFFTIAVRELGIGKSNIFTNFIPVFTAGFSYFILSEHFSIFKIIGMLIVIGGVFLVQKGGKTPSQNQ